MNKPLDPYEQTCKACGIEYNYFENAAIMICEGKHVVCQQCAARLLRDRGSCPHCGRGVCVPANHGGWNGGHNYRHPSSDFDLADKRPNPEPSPIHPQPSSTPLCPNFSPKPLLFLLISLLFLSLGIYLITLKTRQETCQYWNQHSCPHSQYFQDWLWCCPDRCYYWPADACREVSALQDGGAIAGVLVGICGCFLGAFVCCSLCWAKTGCCYLENCLRE